MKISFDAVPIINGKMTGIGWCEVGQTTAMARLHPEDSFYYSFFSRKDDHIKISKLAPNSENIGALIGHFSGLAYRSASLVMPIPYNWFFGKDMDITHFFNYIAPPGVHGKTVITVHDMVCKSFPETVRGRTKKMLDAGLAPSMKRADIIVTDSEFSKREIIKYFPQYEAKIRVVPCGVDLERFKPCEDENRITQVKEKLNIEGDYFLYLGTIEPRKNLERLITAYHMFSKDMENPPKLVLAGGKGWLYDAIFQRVTDLNLSDKVLFTQYIDSEDINPLMCGSLAFVFPSVYEGFGMPPLEAMACGVPVLTADIASLPEVTGDCAVYCDPYSEETIAEGLRTLYSNPELRADLSRRGLERAKTFTWDSSAEQLYEVYKELMK